MVTEIILQDPISKLVIISGYYYVKIYGDLKIDDKTHARNLECSK